MAPRLRKMEAFRPRPRKKRIMETKTTLLDLERKISQDLGALILFIEQKETLKISSLQLRLRADVHKHADQMAEAAKPLGPKAVAAVRQFLDSLNSVLHTKPEFIDPALLHTCYAKQQELEKILQAA